MRPTCLGSTNTVTRIPLSLYFLVTFGGAWLVWAPLLVAEYTGLPLPVPPIVLIVLGSFTPSIAALFLTWRYAGRSEERWERNSVGGVWLSRRLRPL